MAVLVETMAWHWRGAKQISEPILVSCRPTDEYICVTRPQWVKLPQLSMILHHLYGPKCLYKNDGWDYLPTDGITLNTSKQIYILTRPTLERRATLGHLRFINPNIIMLITSNHFANQSQTCQLFKIVKIIFFNSEKRTVESGVKWDWRDIENPYPLSRGW